MSATNQENPTEIQALIIEMRQMRLKQNELLDIIKEKDALIAKLSEKIDNLIQQQNQQKNNTVYSSRNAKKRTATDFPPLSTANRFEQLPIDETNPEEYDTDSSTYSSISHKRTKTTKNPTSTKHIVQKTTQPNSIEDAEMHEIQKESPTASQPANNPPQPKTHHSTHNVSPRPDTHTENSENINKIPPIVLRKAEIWTQISKTLHRNKINFIRATATADGIKIQTATTEDYRKTIKLFDSEKIEYHTYLFQEDKELKIVIRGLHYTANPTEIAEDLINKGFNPSKVLQMKNKRTGSPMPLFLVSLPRSDKKIFDIKHVLDLAITIETLNTTAKIGQCFRCQKYGHSQSNCTATIRCVKCGENHRAADCLLLRTEIPTCANCNGHHVASYRGCPNAPKPKKYATETQQNRSYATVTSNTPQQTTNKNDNSALETIAQTLQNLTKMLHEMQHKNKTNSNDQ